MRTITIPIDLDTALDVLSDTEATIELVATGTGVNITIGLGSVRGTTVADTDPPPRPETPPVAPKAVVAKKMAPAKKAASPAASGTQHTCHCGRTFGSAQAKGVHQARIHGRGVAPVASVPPLPPTPIKPSVTGPPPTSPSPAAPAQAAPTKPSSMCDRGDHTMCKTAQARCNCDCHGRHGQQPPVSAAS